MTTKKYGLQRPNDKKMRELILFIVSRSAGNETFGAVKLNKLLFFADFLAYVNLGESITGHEYQALPQGPAPRQLLPLRAQMETDGEILLVEKDYHGLKQHRILALREADLSVFSAEEIALVDRLIEGFWDANAAEISDLSHQFAGWKFAGKGETIPYNVALVGRREPTPDEIRQGLELESLAAKYK